MAKGAKTQFVIDGKNNTKGAFAAVEKSMAALEKRTASLGRSMAGAFAGLVSISAVKQIGQINSEWVDMSSRLRRVTADEEEFASVTERLGEVAESTWSGLNETIESYLSMQGPLADMGYTTQEQVDFVSALNNALVVSGAKKEVAASVQNALNKAMAGGVLRGENLNTVIEKGGRVADLLAQKMGVTVSELRALGTQGKITGSVIYEALAGNMQLLAAEADAMPATFEDAMQRVEEAFVGAFRDDELMEPLTGSLLELAEVLKDQSTREGLAGLAGGLTTVAAEAVKAIAAFGHFGRDLGYWMARITGHTTDLDRLEKEIEKINRAMNAGVVSKGLSMFFRPDDYALMSAEALKKKREELEEEKQVILDTMSGVTREQRKANEEQAAIASEAKAKELAALRKHVADMKTERDQLVTGVKKAAKDIENAEKDSLKKIEDLRKERLGIEERYRKAIAKLTGAAGPVEATYGNAQLLKVKARDALAKGDLKEAQEYAAAALEILEKIKEEGGNTYGFEGFAKELQAIELAAKDQEIEKEDEKRKKILYDLTKLKELAEEVKNIDIRVDLDEESLANARSKLDQLAKGVDITPSVGGAGAAGASSTTGAAGTANSTASVKVDADIEPAKKTVDRWQIGVSSQSLVVPVDADTGKIRDDLYRAGNSFSDKPIEMPVKLKDGMIREGLWKAGNEFADHPITVAASFDEENLKRGIRRIAGSNEFTNSPIEVPVAAVVSDDAAEEVQKEVDSITPVIHPEIWPRLSEEEAARVRARAAAAAEELKKILTIPVTLQMAGPNTDQLPGYATGGHIRGPGTSTSDSILARLSNGEFVMRAAAVRKYGLDMLHRMNNMQIPQFATGGLVEQVANIEPRQPQSVGTLNFNLPGGESFSVNTAGDFSEDLRRAALKYGKPRR